MAKATAGRPDVYETHIKPHLEKIPKWYKTMTVRQIATKLGVGKTTLYKYAREHPELAEMLEVGKRDLVDDLKCAIKRRALGYDYEETTTKKTVSEKNGMEVVTTTTKKHMPPDLGSIHLLLKNLDPDWHDADQTTIRQREKELQIKKQKADAAEW